MQIIRGLRQTLRLIAGLPSYDAYLAHLRRHHPEKTPLTEAEFARDRQAARFGGSNARCC